MRSHASKAQGVAIAISATAWLLLAVFWILSVGALPERAPVHFDFEGKPDSWTSRAAVAGMMIVVPTLLHGFLIGVAMLVSRVARERPEWLNHPRKEGLLRMRPAERMRALDPLLVLSWALPAPLHVLFGCMIWQTVEVAVGDETRMSMLPVLIVVPTILLGVGAAAWTSVRRVPQSA